MAIKRMCPNAVHFKEFQNDPVTGVHYTATCGETALAAAMVCATPQTESKQDAINLMTSMTREMIGLGWANKPQGATTEAHLHDEALRRGFHVAPPYVSWEDPIPSGTLHPWLLQYAGITPIVLMVTHAGEGLIAVDGSHAEAGVKGHFICVVGLADEGYVTMDGDNNKIESELPIYSWAAIEKAHVTGFLMLELEGAVPSGAVQGGNVIPSGWKDDGKTLSNPVNSNVVVNGFRAYILANPWNADNVPEDNEVGVDQVVLSNPTHGAGSVQFFRDCQLAWTETENVWVVYTGNEAMYLRSQAAALQAQIAALQAAPAPTPEPAPLSDEQQHDLAAMAALRAALAS